MEKGAAHLQYPECSWIDQSEVGHADRPDLPLQMDDVGRSRFLGLRCHESFHAVELPDTGASGVAGYPLITCLLVFLGA